MLKRQFRLPSPALVISMVAFALVLGGTAVAAGTAGDTAADTKLVKKLAASLTVKNALNLGGVPASTYIKGPVEAVHVVGTAGNPAFDTNWANWGFGDQTADFYKDPFGIVHLEGELKHTGSGDGETVFTLPAGYRPPMSQAFAINGNGEGHTATLRISASGDVVISGVTVSGGLYMLNGVTFRAP